MDTYDWDKLLIDRGLMTESEATTFQNSSSIYHRKHYESHGQKIDKSEMEPFFGKEALQYHGRKRSFLAFRHESIVDLIYAISTARPEIVPWSAAQSAKHSLIVSQPHNGVFFANAWRVAPLGDYTSPILKLLSSHAEVLSIYSSSNDDPCSYQCWREGKCVRAIEWIPHPQTLGKVIDFGASQLDDPTYVDRPWYDDINRALEVSGYAGHRIPPLKSKDDEAYAWKVYLPDILK